MTICEELGYRVGDRFEKVGDSDVFTEGSIIELVYDDGTDVPQFRLISGEVADWLQPSTEAFEDVKTLRKIYKVQDAGLWAKVEDQLSFEELQMDNSGLLLEKFFSVPSMAALLESAKSEKDIFKTSSDAVTSLGATGIKADSGKLRHSLLPTGALDEVLEVLEFGAKKYAVDNWKKVEDAETRYYDAAHRHLAAYWNGEKTDPESKRHHLAHAICCAMFLMWFDQNNGN